MTKIMILSKTENTEQEIETANRLKEVAEQILSDTFQGVIAIHDRTTKTTLVSAHNFNILDMIILNEKLKENINDIIQNVKNKN